MRRRLPAEAGDVRTQSPASPAAHIRASSTSFLATSRSLSLVPPVRAQVRRTSCLPFVREPRLRHVAPELLEPVELARRRGEHVHDDVEVVEQDPVSLPLALGPRGAHALLSQAALDLIGDGLGLTGVAAREDDEPVRERDRLAHLEQDGVGGLLLVGQADGLCGDRPAACQLLVLAYCRSFAFRSEPMMTTSVVAGRFCPLSTTPRPSIARTSSATPRAWEPARIWVCL